MALEIQCDKCDEELDEPGGLFFSPPNRDGMVVKFHLCIRCADKIFHKLLK